MGYTSQKQSDATQIASPLIFDLLLGFWKAMILRTVTRLGLPDALKDGPQTVADLATIAGVLPDQLYRVLRAAASLSIFQEIEDGSSGDTAQRRFAPTAQSVCLQSDQPDSMHDLVLMELSDWEIDSWKNLLHPLRTGQRAFDAVCGVPLWQYLDQQPEESAIFNRAMVSLSDKLNEPIVKAYNFSEPGMRTVVDIGGGHGNLLMTLLREHPSIHGILFDREAVIEEAKKRIEQAGFDGQCRCVGGDFFQSVPEGADCYIFKQVLHDWDDASCQQILGNTRRAVRSGTKVLIVEMMMEDANPSAHSALLDIQMMVITGGRERTVRQYQSLLESAGFAPTRVIPTLPWRSIVEGVAR